MGFVRDYQCALKIVFLTLMILLVSGNLGWRQPILFIIGYIDVAIILFLFGLIFVFAKRFISTL